MAKLSRSSELSELSMGFLNHQGYRESSDLAGFGRGRRLSWDDQEQRNPWYSVLYLSNRMFFVVCLRLFCNSGLIIQKGARHSEGVLVFGWWKTSRYLAGALYWCEGCCCQCLCLDGGLEKELDGLVGRQTRLSYLEFQWSSF